MTKVWKSWYQLLMTLHEMCCSDGLYQVHKGDIGTVVIHDPCGHVWSVRQ